MDYREVIQSVWPDWQAKEILGKGSYGTVFRAVKEKFGVRKESAIKVVHIPTDDNQIEQVRHSFHLSDKELKEYFYPEVEKLKEEVALMEKLGENEHCLHIQDFDILEKPEGSIGWNILIRMELLESLESRISRGGIKLGEALSLGEDILSALETCESHRIIHRDIKPANIFVNSNGVYKLGDFGIAKDLTLDSRNLSYRGTDNYAAPEVCQGRDYSYNVDIYALGLVLYQLLNKNKRPFFGEGKVTSSISEEAYKKRLTGEEFPAPAFRDEELFAVIKKMCAFDPKERFQSALEAKSELQAYREKHRDKLDTILEFGQKRGIEVHNAKSSGYINEKYTKEHTENASETGKRFNRPSSDIEFREGTYTERNHYDEVDISEDYTRSLNYSERERRRQSEGKRVGQINVADNNQSKNDVIADTSGSDNSQKDDKYNDIRVAKAEEIALVLDLFEIDKDSLDIDNYIKYVHKFRPGNSTDLSKIEGIYIGTLANGIPHGYGVFWHECKINKDGEKRKVINMNLGEWENGNLKSGTEVERMSIFYLQYNDGSYILSTYSYKDEWRDGWFIHDEAYGVFYYQKVTNIDGTKVLSKWTFTGKLGVNNIGCIKGIKTYSSGDYEDGEFKDSALYNGRVYNADGSVKYYVKNGEEQERE